MDKRDTGESIEEEEKGVEVNIGNCVTEEEEDGTVTVLKLSNLRIGGAGSNDL
jgi:hypothetical protein